MKGYPKHIATKQDFINLLDMPDFKEQALKDLEALYELEDDTIERVVSSSIDEKGNMTDIVTEIIPNPLPMYKRMGFKDKDEVAALL